jgi:hypothetical protein
MHTDARLADCIVALGTPRAGCAAEGAREDLAHPTSMINSAHYGIGVGSLGDGAAVVFMDGIAGLAGP